MKKIFNIILVIMFGKESLEGYYNPQNDKSDPKNYVFSSVFPNREVMKMVIDDN